MSAPSSAGGSIFLGQPPQVKIDVKTESPRIPAIPRTPRGTPLPSVPIRRNSFSGPPRTNCCSSLVQEAEAREQLGRCGTIAGAGIRFTRGIGVVALSSLAVGWNLLGCVVLGIIGNTSRIFCCGKKIREESAKHGCRVLASLEGICRVGVCGIPLYCAKCCCKSNVQRCEKNYFRQVQHCCCPPLNTRHPPNTSPSCYDTVIQMMSGSIGPQIVAHAMRGPGSTTFQFQEQKFTVQLPPTAPTPTKINPLTPPATTPSSAS